MTLGSTPLLHASPAVVRRGASARVLLACAAVFLAARVVTSAFLLWLTTQTTARSEAGAAPSFARISSVWDGRWYERIALHGYPLRLPVGPHGAVEQNAWAFLPGYPVVTRVVAAATGADWAVAAIATSLVFGVGAAVLLGVLLTPHTGPRRAVFAVALFSVSPVSFILQMTYAESMTVCLVLGALCLLERHRYASAVPLVLAVSLTRPGVLAFALACLLHLIARRRELRQRPFEAARGVVLLVVSGVGGLAWPVIVGVVTHDPDGYVRTETAWRALWTGSTAFSAFEPWVFVAGQLFGAAGLPVLGLVLAASAWFVLRGARVLGTTIRIWIASYGLYLLAVFLPQTSLPRLLIPMSPALGAVPLPRSRAAAAALLIGSTALQLTWLWCTYGPVKTYLTVP